MPVAEFPLVTAEFINPDDATRAIGALQDHGIHAAQISVLTPGTLDAEPAPTTDKDGFMLVQTDDPPTPTDMNAATEDRRGGQSTRTFTDNPIAAEGERGLTTTTPADAARGAVKGGATGLILGIVAGVVALTIPGIGPVLAAGPLWAAIAGVGAATVGGAVTGGVVGYLEDQGVPGVVAGHHADALTRGSIAVTVHLGAHNTEAAVTEVLTKYGGDNVVVHTAA